MRVGVAGLGKMGAAIAARLMECGHDVIVWNRSPDKAKPLADAGAIVASSPADLATQAEAIVNLLLERIEAKDLPVEPARIEIEPVLWPGGSCGCREQKLKELYRINTLGSLEKNMMLNFNRNILEEQP